MHGYWSKVLQRRQSRRRALIGIGTLGTSAAALSILGCGGNDEGSGSNVTAGSPTGGRATGGSATGGTATGGTGSGGQASILTPPQDRTSEAVVGGTLHTNTSALYNLDPISGLHGGFKVQNSPLFNRIFRAKAGVLEPSQGEIIGDAAESYEVSGDGLQLTVRLRPNLGTEPRPPVNGRNLDAQDVLFSWELFEETSSVRATLVQSVDPNAPVQSVTAPDDRTIVFNLAAPSVLLEGYLGDGFYFWIIPKEASDQYDRRVEAHGAGPWYMEEFESDVRMTLTRNPNYYQQGLPYFERIEVPVLPEASTQLAQLEAGAIDISGSVYGTAGITNDNVIDVYKRHSEMTIFEDFAATSGRHLRVGYADGSPFHDIRMRKALSMLMDREALANHFTSSDRLGREGLDFDPVWVSHMAPVYPISYDLRDAALDAHRAHLEYNPEEALKLVRAAGQEGVPINVIYYSGSQVDGQVLADQIRQAGLETTEEVLEPNPFIETVVRQRGNYQGVGVHLVGTGPGPEQYLWTGFEPTTETACFRSKEDFPELTSISDAIFRELDGNRRQELVREWTVQAAADMPSIPVGVYGPNYHLAWPWIANVGVYQRWIPSYGNLQDSFMHYWYDAAKDTRD